MKRLYIGGLGHTISQKDIKDRFGKFGEVSDVEIITRKDEHGAPLKTFGYVNINITDAEYKRCMNILNKSTWKGGTLLIQPAKESFLHRLAEERQQIAEKTKTPEINPQEKLVDSLKAAGVENFHMKAAVPGTEIPGHKDWTVSKFGRVLPVLNLKCKGKNKIFKYDPSKHCHNIKRLDATDDFTPVSKLTWEVSGGDDEISKKRRGEFPQYKPSPKRSQGETSLSLRNFTPSNGIKTPSAIEQKNAMVIQENGLPPKGKQKPAVKNSVRVFDSDADSEDEIRMLVDQERLRNPKQMFTGGDDDNLEVVGDDFVVKSNVVWGGAEQDGVKSLLTSSREDEEYDSADTDEILNQSKSLSETGKPQNLEPAPVSQDSPAKSSKNKDKTNSVPVSSSSESDSGSHDDSDDDSEDLDDDDSEDSDYEAMMSNCYRLDLSLADLEQLAKNVEVSSDDEKKEAQKTQQPSVSNKKHGNNPEDILASLLGDNTPEKDRKKKQVSTVSLPAFIGTKDLFGDPNPASSELNLKRAGPSIDCESTVGSKRLKQNSKLSEQGVSVDKSQQVQPFSNVNKIEESDTSSKNDSSSEESDSSEEEDGEDEDDCSEVLTSKTVSTSQSVRTGSVPKTDQTLSTSLPTSDHSVSSTDEDSSSDDEEDTEEKIVESKDSNTQIKQVPKTTKTKPSASHSSSDSSSEESETSDEDDQKSSRTQLKDSKKVESHSMVLHSTVPDAQKQQQDNQKRLAALEQRQKETEQQKKLIQGALANVDTPSTNRGKHIVFDSDDELEGDETTSKQEEQTTSQKKGRFEDDSESDEDQQRVIKEVSKGNENKKTGGSKLFDSSDDEDDGDEDDRFQIKPQFEGKAGQKLMKLQARFGTDSRFQMDSRFLDSDNEMEDQDENPPEKDGEQDLVDEKNKNLDILQSVLNTSIPSKDPRKESVKSKTFKDVSALHYDPTREEHAAFETKKEESKKESKAARRKKREEAEKLPEVSKEIYFDVAADLKEVFVAPKEKPDENETVSWDKKTETTEDKTAEEDTAMDLSFMTNDKTNTEAAEGFKFSFFEEDPVAEKSTKTDEYKIETLKGSKLSWQVDPRFQDSSSEEEEVDEAEENQTASCMTTEEPTQTKKSFFFFFLGDERLKEGPAMFCRSTKLEEQREAWEETRASLREECRKKHKDAKRRQRTLKT